MRPRPIFVRSALATGLIMGLAACVAVPTQTPKTDWSSPSAEASPTPGIDLKSAETGQEQAVLPATPTRPITLAFGGDVHFQNQLAPLLSNPKAALDPIRGPLAKADIAMVNLETALTTRGTPEPKNYTFRTSPTALKALAAGGVDLVTMANNHAADFGADGLADTLAAKADSKIPVVGIGSNRKEAHTPAKFNIDGTTVAIFGTTQFPDRTSTVWAAGKGKPGVSSALQPSYLLKAVEREAAQSDVVVVYLHWGIEGMDCPTADQSQLADDLAEAGADAIVGSHVHRLLGSGWKNGAYVAYGLGNFIWYSSAQERTRSTGVLTLKIEDGKVVRESLAPAVIPYGGMPYLLTGDAKKNAKDSYANLRNCTDLSAKPSR